MGLFSKDEKPESHFTTPRFPVHPLVDVITGEWMKCEKGDYTMNGGLCPHMAVTGKGNSNKTLIMLSIICTFLLRNRHIIAFDIDAQIYETENTLEYMRCIQIARGMARVMGATEEEIDEIIEWFADHFILRNSSKLGGNAFYDEMNELCEARIKKNKDKILLPFRDFKGRPIEIFVPHICGIDSFSALEPGVVTEKFLDENTAGSSDNNTMYLKEAGAKTQMLQKWLNQNPRSSIYMISSAHMGDNINMDPRAPAEKKIMFMKQNHKLKNVPEKYYFYVSCMFFVNGSTMMINNDKVPIYPLDSTDKEKRDSKDIRLELIVLRNKHGQSGAFIPLIANQNTGIEWHLSAFDYCKDNGRWGFSGDNTNYVLDLLPDVKLNRSVIRRKLDDDARLRRVVDINCELQLMYRYQFDKVPRRYRCTPKELYDGLTGLGYDWNSLLLNTRSFYTLDHYDNPVPPLSTYDMLRMRVGEYIPYWMDEADIPEGAKKLRDDIAAKGLEKAA